MTTKWIGEDGRPHDHTSFCRANGCTPVPATPAPSQPAGARLANVVRWLRDRGIVNPVLYANERETTPKGTDAATWFQDYADTEIATLKREHALADLRTAEEEDAREAAERERDSYKEALEQIAEYAVGESGKCGVICNMADAALKAEKDGQK